MMSEQEYLDKIQLVINEETGKDMPETAPAIATVMTRFRPADFEGRHHEITSEDVLDYLDAICSPTLNDVTKVLLFLGYKLNWAKMDFNIYWSVIPCGLESRVMPSIFDSHNDIDTEE